MTTKEPSRPFRAARFLTSAPGPREFPPDRGREAAFAGRSNAGKSSVINALTDQKGLARTSRTPGRTQLINFFTVNDAVRLVDLPGYGFARVPAPVRAQWEENLVSYLEERRSLAGIVLIMDIRHPFTPLDRQLLDLLWRAHCPVHVLLNKADKLTRGAAAGVLRDLVRKEGSTLTLQLFSATRNEGVQELEAVLAGWLLA